MLYLIEATSSNFSNIGNNEIDVVILCYGCNNDTSFKNIKDKWLPNIGLIETNEFDPALLLVGTKAEKVSKNDDNSVSLEDATSFAKSNAMKHMRCSSKIYAKTMGKKGNVEKVFNQAIQKTMSRYQRNTKMVCNIL